MAVEALISKYIELEYLWYNLWVEHFFSTNKNFFTYTLLEKIVKLR